MRARDFRQRAWSAMSVSLISGALGGLSIIGVGAIALLLITGPLALGVTHVYLSVVRGGSAELSDTFSGFKNFASAFLLQLLIEIFTALWSLLFIIPGIIKSYSYSMSFYILHDNPQMPANEARKMSMQMMRGNKWRLFCLDLSFIGWFLLSILTFGILLFWVEPYQGVARAEFYQNLLEEQGLAQSGVNYGPVNGGPVNGANYGNGGAPNGNGINGAQSGANGANADPFARDASMELDGNQTNGAPQSQNTDGTPDKSQGDGQPPLNADDL